MSLRFISSEPHSLVSTTATTEAPSLLSSLFYTRRKGGWLWHGGDDAATRLSASTYGPLRTLGRFWTMYHVVMWVSRHRQYISLGAVLGEYLAKNALAYLPPSQSEQAAHLLLSLSGVDVHKVDLATVGKTALSVAMTNTRLDPIAVTASVPHDAATLPLPALLRELLDDIRRIAHIAEHVVVPQGAHATYAAALRALGAVRNAYAAAKAAYGPELAVWTTRMPHTADCVPHAYEAWRECAIRAREGVTSAAMHA